ncbi:MAG: hypothetical protein U1E76_15075 [Planctomycetota bacterium]
MMAAWFSDPDFAELVSKHFVPVRLRCRPWDFDLDFPSDPLAPIGTTLDGGCAGAGDRATRRPLPATRSAASACLLR